MTENQYQAKLIRQLKIAFPDCVVMKNDSGHQQGIPDLLVLYGNRWAALEVKVSAFAEEQPNQRWFIKKFNEMSFAAFIHPKNEAEVLHQLIQFLDKR